MEGFTNTIIVFAVIIVLAVESWGIYHSMQFRSRLMFLVPWTLAVIITIYLLSIIDFLQIAHNAEHEIARWMDSWTWIPW
jgi:hypothetical protein